MIMLMIDFLMVLIIVRIMDHRHGDYDDGDAVFGDVMSFSSINIKI